MAALCSCNPVSCKYVHIPLTGDYKQQSYQEVVGLDGGYTIVIQGRGLHQQSCLWSGFSNKSIWLKTINVVNIANIVLQDQVVYCILAKNT